MEVTIRSLSARPTACIRVHTTTGHIGEAFGTELPKVAAHVAAVGAVIAGPPYARYHAYGPEGVDMEVGFPIATPISHDGEVIPAELPTVDAAVAIHEGAYDQLGTTYEQLERWIVEHGHEPDAGMWENHLTDPESLPDTAQWRTEVVWPLKD